MSFGEVMYLPSRPSDLPSSVYNIGYSQVLPSYFIMVYNSLYYNVLVTAAVT